MTSHLKPYQRIVIKIGSALLVDRETGLRQRWLESLLSDVATFAAAGTQILIVSSGAIALGRQALKSRSELAENRPLKLEESQAAAAIGQIALGHVYAKTLESHGIIAAQILLTFDDTEQRRRYLNARNTIATALAWDVVPIINENDTVATAEIRYGDNDRLAATSGIDVRCRFTRTVFRHRRAVRFAPCRKSRCETDSACSRNY